MDKASMPRQHARVLDGSDIGAIEALLARLLGSAQAKVPARAAPDADPTVLVPLLPLVRVSSADVVWSAINGRRIDISVRSGDREWTLVLTADRAGIESVVVFEKPVVFPGQPGGRAVLLIGPSSVGKSTVMSALIERSEWPWVMFDELSFGAIPLRHLIWRETAPTLRPGFLAGIAALAAAGNQIVAPGDRELLAALRSAGTEAVVVALLCPPATLVERQAARSDRWGGLTEDTQRAYDGWNIDLRIDTGDLSPMQSAQAILEFVGQPARTRDSAGG